MIRALALLGALLALSGLVATLLLPTAFAAACTILYQDAGVTLAGCGTGQYAVVVAPGSTVVVQTQTPTPTNTPTNTATATPTSTFTPTPRPTDTPTNTSTPTMTPTATSTPTITPTWTAIPFPLAPGEGINILCTFQVWVTPTINGVEVRCPTSGPLSGSATVFQMANASATDASVTMTYQDVYSTPVASPIMATVPAGGSTTIHVRDVAAVPSPFLGSVRLDSDVPIAATVVGYDTPLARGTP